MSTLHKQIVLAVRAEIERINLKIPISPTGLAVAVQSGFFDGDMEVHIDYASLEHIKQISRSVLAGRFSADSEENETHQFDIFSGKLQDRYPLPRERGKEPLYKDRDDLTHDEVKWNVLQLRKAAGARLAHSDALQAWDDNRENVTA